MILRTRKSLGGISTFLGNLHGPNKKTRKLSPSHLIWILLASASEGPQYAPVYVSSVDRLVKTLATEKGIHSVIRLQNTNPACTLTGSKAASAKSSPASLLVYVDTHETFLATLQKLRALLEYSAIAKSATGTQILHWSISTYACIQFHEPKRSRDMAGKCVVVVAIDPASGQDGDVDAWYRKEHLNQLSTSPLFLRCRRYSRIVDPESIGEDGRTTAKFLAMHDYTSVQDLFDHSVAKGQLVEETEWTRRVMDGAKGVERTIWTMCDVGVNVRT